jgi:hypothetical protein
MLLEKYPAEAILVEVYLNLFDFMLSRCKALILTVASDYSKIQMTPWIGDYHGF